MRKIPCPDPKILAGEYASGSSARQLSKKYGVCKRTVLQWMTNAGIARRDRQEAATAVKRTLEFRARMSKKMSLVLGASKKATDNRSAKRASRGRYWRGDAATYFAFHMRVRRRFGSPKKCSVCGSADPNKRYEWANLTGHYEDINDYARMCVPCHRKHDHDNNIEAYIKFHAKRGVDVKRHRKRRKPFKCIVCGIDDVRGGYGICNKHCDRLRTKLREGREIIPKGVSRGNFFRSWVKKYYGVRHER